MSTDFDSGGWSKAQVHYLIRSVQLENVGSGAFGMNSSNQFKLTTSGQLMLQRGTVTIGDRW